MYMKELCSRPRGKADDVVALFLRQEFIDVKHGGGQRKRREAVPAHVHLAPDGRRLETPRRAGLSHHVRRVSPRTIYKWNRRQKSHGSRPWL